jgi:hypothetical protein
LNLLVFKKKNSKTRLFEKQTSNNETTQKTFDGTDSLHGNTGQQPSCMSHGRKGLATHETSSRVF